MSAELQHGGTNYSGIVDRLRDLLHCDASYVIQQVEQLIRQRDEAADRFRASVVAAPQGDDPRGSYTDGFRDGWKAHFDTLSPALVQQLCRDLNEAHNEILRQQGMAESDFGKYDWPEWSPQANSIRWAERETKTRQAKTDQWTLYPKQEQAPAPAEGKTGRID